MENIPSSSTTFQVSTQTKVLATLNKISGSIYNGTTPDYTNKVFNQSDSPLKEIDDESNGSSKTLPIILIIIAAVIVILVILVLLIRHFKKNKKNSDSLPTYNSKSNTTEQQKFLDIQEKIDRPTNAKY
ncbi:hypothetical protein H8356DRAFT_1665959 [Neocallimastix lanati (nom. inval.)]|jgi:beta-lactamase regulating signal transducer with metallopeptidase domain|uniref:Uncharacterized protein n=1 Tax=Neocallimastix californiae TaxID=1754190 RepID=A0A1Y2FB15_9FUNG|nr:hypothetical protein H8356DRAFT_1665959 [Neocallimastix sp. JGI-2020a]ORY81108.1 hypothetical protein LY90DRAFT_697750 [Neocallimastix californiae]|eukprot:ORY81108.1 hypothetical protein LY90DRAFT_697750 [Neocallimastix californiae]